MTKIKVLGDGAKYLPWAKKKLIALRQLREDLQLPRMAKAFKPAPDALVWISASEHGDWIRIEAGAVPYSLTAYMSPSFTVLRRLNSVKGKVLAPALSRLDQLAGTGVTTPPTYVFADAGLPGTDSGSPSGAGIDSTFSPTLGGAPFVQQLFNVLYRRGDGGFRTFKFFRASSDPLDSRVLRVDYDPVEDVWAEDTAHQFPTEVRSASTGLSTLDSSVTPHRMKTTLTMPAPFPGGSTIDLFTPVSYGRSGSPSTTGDMPMSDADEHTVGSVTFSYVTSATPRTVYEDYADGVPPQAVAARGVYYDLEGEERTWVFRRDPETLALTVLKDYTLSWTAVAFFVRKSAGGVFIATPSNQRINLMSASSTGIQMSLGEVGKTPTITSGSVPDYNHQPTGGDAAGTWYYARSRVSSPAATETPAAGPIYNDNTATTHAIELVLANSPTLRLEAFVNDVSVWSLTGATAKDLLFSNNGLYTMRHGKFAFGTAGSGTRFLRFWDGSSMLSLAPSVGLVDSWAVAPDDSAVLVGWRGDYFRYYRDGALVQEVALEADDKVTLALDEVDPHIVHTTLGLAGGTVSQSRERKFAQDPDTLAWSYAQRDLPVQQTFTLVDVVYTILLGDGNTAGFLTPLNTFSAGLRGNVAY